MESTSIPDIKPVTVNKNKRFLNACIYDLKRNNFSIKEIVKRFGVSKNLFYSAVKLGYFKKEKIRVNKCIYSIATNNINYNDAYLITLKTYNEAKIAIKAKQTEKEITEETKPEMKPTLPTKGIQVVKKPLSEIKFTHLQSETDEDLIAELKRRGYQGTIEIKKQVTL